MAAVFISHRSSDHEAALAVATALRRMGFGSLFLDIDPHSGIPPGLRWDEVLFDRMRRARAVVVVHTAMWSSSRWCLTEALHALALGRPVIVLRFDQAGLEAPLDRIQAIDASASRPFEESLRQALMAVGLHRWQRTEPWPPDRSPYIGMRPLRSGDEDMLFGRSEEVLRLVEHLHLVRNARRPAMVVLLGPSGTGKSSLMSAGVLPRLNAAAQDWQVLDTIRPSLSRVPGAPSKLNRSGRWCVQPIDQLEELVGLNGEVTAKAWLADCSKLLAAGDCIALATLRTDALPLIEDALRDAAVPLELVPILPIDIAGLRECVEGPAELANIGLDEGLADRMAKDCGDGFALPMLAFTLVSMFDRTSPPRRFSHELYGERLGGIQGSVQRCVDAALPQSASARDVERLFLRLVRLGEQNQFLRRQARLDLMPADLLALVDPLVEARLLVTGSNEAGERHVEVAHEAVFTHWPRLGDALNARRSFLEWRRRFELAIGERREHGVSLSMVLLNDLDRWVREGLVDLDPDDAAGAQEDRRMRRSERGAIKFLAGARLTTAIAAVSLLATWVGKFIQAPFVHAATQTELPQVLWALVLWGIGGAIAAVVGLPHGRHWALQLGLSFFWLGAAAKLVQATLPSVVSLPLFGLVALALLNIARILGSALWPAPNAQWGRWSKGIVAVMCLFETRLIDARAEGPSMDQIVFELARDGDLPGIGLELAAALSLLAIVASVLRPATYRLAVRAQQRLAVGFLYGLSGLTVLIVCVGIGLAMAAESARIDNERIDGVERDVEALVAAQSAYLKREGQYAVSLQALLQARDGWVSQTQNRCRVGDVNPKMLESLALDLDLVSGVKNTLPVKLWIVDGKAWRVGLLDRDSAEGRIVCIGGDGRLPTAEGVPTWAERVGAPQTRVQCERPPAWLLNLQSQAPPPQPPRGWPAPLESLECEELLRR